MGKLRFCVFGLITNQSIVDLGTKKEIGFLRKENGMFEWCWEGFERRGGDKKKNWITI